MGVWQLVADMGSRNSAVVVGNEAQRVERIGQRASEVEIPDLRLVDSRNPFAFARTSYRGPMKGCLALRRSPAG